MLEECVTENLVDALPIARNQALLVEIDKVALHLLIRVGGLLRVFFANQIIANLVALDLLERVAEGLQLLHSSFAEQLFDDL